MNRTQLLILFMAIILLLSWCMKESFTSPGTMVQLATSHVPTQEDYNFFKWEYPQIVRRDITDMTGGDPGPIQVPYPQLWM
jgi:hypothetical protein